MSSTATPIPLPSTPHRSPLQLPLLVAVAAMLLAFAPTLISFPPAWLTRGGQGFVAAGFALYLLWRDRQKLLHFGAAVPEASLVVAGFSLLWLVAYVLTVQVVHQAAMPLVMLTWLLAIGGVRPALVALPAVAVFFLAVPVWGVLTGVLQGMTIVVNGLLLSVAGIDAVIRGENIAIDAGVFWVAQGCAGLNYFETSLLISVIYSLLFLKQWRYRFVAMGVAVLLALVSNWLRVFGLIVIGHVTNMQSSLIADHELYGWVIFAVVMLIFFAITRHIENRDRRNTAAPATAASLQKNSPRTRPLSPATVALPTMAAIIGPLLFFALGGRSTSGSAPVAVPGIATTRTNSSEPVLLSTANALRASGEAADSAWRPLYAGADQHTIQQYALADDTVRLDRLSYAEQGQGKELISGLNVIAAQERRLSEQTVGPLDATGRMMNTTIVRTPEGARLVWHWFSVAGSVTHSSTRAKLLELLSFVRSQSPPAELITVSTLCEPNNCTAANSTLYEFVVGRPMPN